MNSSYHPSGKSAYAIASAVGESDEFQRGVGTLAQPPAAESIQAAEEGEVVTGGEFFVKGRALGDEADTLRIFSRRQFTASTLYANAPYSRLKNAGDRAECGTLPGTVRTEESEDLAGFEFKAQAFDRCEFAVEDGNIFDGKSRAWRHGVLWLRILRKKRR